MNLMHTNEIEKYKGTMNVLMHGYESIKGNDGKEYYVPNYQFSDYPGVLHFLSRYTVSCLYGSNAERMKNISVNLGDVLDVANDCKDIICFDKMHLTGHFPSDRKGMIKPSYMDNRTDISVPMIPSLIKNLFVKCTSINPFQLKLD